MFQKLQKQQSSRLFEQHYKSIADQRYIISRVVMQMQRDMFMSELNLKNSVFFSKSKQSQQENFTKDLEFVKLESTGSGIILLSQDYTKLFYEPHIQLELPIQSVTVRFYGHQNDKWLIKLVLSNEFISCSLNAEFVQRHRLANEGGRERSRVKLFPDAKRAPFMLQQKLWIQINRLTQTLSVSLGDIVQNEQNVIFAYQFCQDELKQGWNNEVDVFPMPNYVQRQVQTQSKKRVNLLQMVRFFKVSIEIAESGKPGTQQKVEDYYKVKVLNIGRLFNPVLQKNPSLLRPSVASLQSMPKAIKILYNYLENLQLQNLPDYEQSDPSSQKNGASDKTKYLQWRDFEHALHHSLTTPFGYTTDGKPIGILNHLYKIKTKRQFSALSFNEKGHTFESKEKLMQHIYESRGGYLRLELLPHQGLSPGSMAVMEIWPPFHCSSIHNHGASYGLVKVLAGNVRVENYTQLSFDALQQKPYLISDYAKGQMTWLSQFSFGIHRLVNLHPQTCITLQSYYRHQNSKQYFSAVGMMQKKGVYKEYYPQNDWKCYLELINEKVDEKSHVKNEDLEFIKQVIGTYDLQFYSELNTSFERLALILRDEYDYAVNFSFSLEPSKLLIRTASNGANRHVIIWMDKDPKNIDLIHSTYLKNQKIQIMKRTPSEIGGEGFRQLLRLLKYSDRKIIFIYNIGCLQKEQGEKARIGDMAAFFELVCRIFKEAFCIGLCYQCEMERVRGGLNERKLERVRLQISPKEVCGLVVRHFKE